MIRHTLKQKGARFRKEALFVPDEKTGVKAVREESTLKAVVTVSSGKAFDAGPVSRLNILAAIDAAAFTHKTEGPWRLADNTTQTVSLDELREANALALEKFGALVGVTA